jgi:hypothetical protein
MSPAINQHKQATIRTTFHGGFFLGFPINSEDAGDMFWLVEYFKFYLPKGFPNMGIV